MGLFGRKIKDKLLNKFIKDVAVLARKKEIEIMRVYKAVKPAIRLNSAFEKELDFSGDSINVAKDVAELRIEFLNEVIENAQEYIKVQKRWF